MDAEYMRLQVSTIEERLRTADIYLMGAENELAQAVSDIMLIAIGTTAPELESALRIGPLITSDTTAARHTLSDMRQRIADYKGKL